MKGAVVALACVLLLTALAQAGGLTLTADQVEADSRSGKVLARGRVWVSDGATTLTGERLVLDVRVQQAILVRGRMQAQDGTLEAGRIHLFFAGPRIVRVLAREAVALETPRGVVFADTVEARPDAGRLMASGDVRVFVPPDVVAFGPQLVYGRAPARLRMGGPVRVQSAQGVLRGRTLEASEEGWVRVEGEVLLEYADTTGRAGSVVLFGREKRVVLEGDVFLQRRRDRLWADRVTLFYEQGRVVAERVRRLVVVEEAEG
ncbi:MAG: hypothetical protein C4304_06540 [candidate division GAL15 bacterium]